MPAHRAERRGGRHRGAEGRLGADGQGERVKVGDPWPPLTMAIDQSLTVGRHVGEWTLGLERKTRSDGRLSG